MWKLTVIDIDFERLHVCYSTQLLIKQSEGEMTYVAFEFFHFLRQQLKDNLT